GRPQSRGDRRAARSHARRNARIHLSMPQAGATAPGGVARARLRHGRGHMSTDPDKDWLDALAGRAAGSATPAHAEGQPLRTMMRAHLAQRAAADQAIASTIATPDPMRERALVERARREGLLPAEPVQRATRLNVGWRPMLLAAALAMVAVGIVWQSVMRPE